MPIPTWHVLSPFRFSGLNPHTNHPASQARSFSVSILWYCLLGMRFCQLDMSFELIPQGQRWAYTVFLTEVRFSLFYNRSFTVGAGMLCIPVGQRTTGLFRNPHRGLGSPSTLRWLKPLTPCGLTQLPSVFHFPIHGFSGPEDTAWWLCYFASSRCWRHSDASILKPFIYLFSRWMKAMALFLGKVMLIHKTFQFQNSSTDFLLRINGPQV